MSEKRPFLLDKTNYIIMVVGLVFVAVGLLLMAGGRTPNPEEFHPEEIYSFTRITLAPILIMLGFAIEVYAIMKRPAQKEA